MRSLDDLTMYVYGLIDDPQREELEAHLDVCPACADRVHRIRGEHRLFQGALVRQASDPLAREEILSDVLARRAPAPPSSYVPRSTPPARPEKVSVWVLAFRLATTTLAFVRALLLPR